MSEEETRLASARERPAGASADEEWFRRRLSEAGRRPPLPAADLARLGEAARRAWQRTHGQRIDRRVASRSWRPAWAALVAAGLGALALLGYWLTQRGASESREPVGGASPIARLELVTGEVEMRSSSAAEWEPCSSSTLGGDLAAGAELRSGTGERAGWLALRWSGGASLRIDRASSVRLLGSTEVELARGAIYVDSPPGAASALTVRTAHGRFTEIGTQFEVRVDGEGWGRLRVREGRVALTRDGEQSIAEAGQELTVRPGAAIARGSVPRFGEPWAWAVAAAPMLDIEGVSVRGFLDWAAREAGWRLEFADRASEEVAGRARLHGSMRHLTPATAPAALLPTAGLACRIEGGTLHVWGGEEARTPR